jgi:hypothetical protein
MRLLNLNQAGWENIPHNIKLIIISLRHSRSGACRYVLAANRESGSVVYTGINTSKYEAGSESDFRATVLEFQNVGIVNRLWAGKWAPGFHSALI